MLLASRSRHARPIYLEKGPRRFKVDRLSRANLTRVTAAAGNLFIWRTGTTTQRSSSSSSSSYILLNQKVKTCFAVETPQIIGPVSLVNLHFLPLIQTPHQIVCVLLLPSQLSSRNSRVDVREIGDGHHFLIRIFCDGRISSFLKVLALKKQTERNLNEKQGSNS